MSSSNEKIEVICQRLLQLTIKDKLEWKITDAPVSILDGSNDLIPLFFQTKFKGQNIGIFVRRYQDYSGDFDQFFWNETVGFVLMNGKGQALLEGGRSVRALNDLIEVVREKLSGVDKLLDDLLAEDEEV